MPTRAAQLPARPPGEASTSDLTACPHWRAMRTQSAAPTTSPITAVACMRHLAAGRGVADLSPG